MEINQNSIGRLEYVEPNDFAVNSPQNIPPHMEDLSIFVDLIVEVVDRDACGIVNDLNKHKIKLSWNQSNGKITFMGGDLKTNMLTTTYADISLDEYKNGGFTEGIGIDMIDISFDSWMYPTVVIKFTDVRGLSLMNAEDYAHNTSNDRRGGSFFKAFFTYPYPKFTLKVKGFYGKPCTFELCPNDFKTIFNSTTGSFDITCKFIGYMYGILADVPVKYILTAPYDTYAGEKYWQEKINDGTFVYEDTQAPMETLPMFQRKCKNIGQTLTPYNSSNPIANKLRNLTQVKNSLKEIQEKYTQFIDTFSNIKITDKNNNNILFLLNKEGENTTQETLRNNFYESLKIYNKNNNALLLPIPDKSQIEDNFYSINLTSINNNLNIKIYKTPYFNQYFNAINDNNQNRYSLVGEDEIKRIINNDEKYISWTNSGDLKQKIKSLIEKNNNNNDKTIKDNIFGYFFDDNGFTEEISKRINNIEYELSTLDEDINKELVQVSKDLLGFTPSIRNIYKLILAHMQTFLHSMYTCMGNIKAESSERTFEKYNLSINQTDLNYNVSSNTFIPPFIEIRDEKNEEISYPNEMIADRMQETKLIDGIIEGSKKWGEDIKLANTPYESKNSSQNTYDFIPTLMTDLFNPENPYKTVLNGVNSNEYHKYILSFFILRLCIFFRENNLSVTIDEVQNFCEKEAFNLYKTGNILYPLSKSFNELSKIQDVNKLDKIINYGWTEGFTLFAVNGKKNAFGKEIIQTKDSSSMSLNELYEFIKKENTVAYPININNINDLIASKDETIDKILQSENFIVDENTDSDRMPNKYEMSFQSLNKSIEIKKYIKSINTEGLIEEKNSLINEEKWNIDINEDFLKRFFPYNQNNMAILNDKVDGESYINQFLTRITYLPIRTIIGNAQGIYENYYQLKFPTSNGISIMDNINTLIFNKRHNEIKLYMPFLMCANMSLYGMPLFYKQNLRVKSFLYLHALPTSTVKAINEIIDILNDKDNIGSMNIIPKLTAVFIGALLKRKKSAIKEETDFKIKWIEGNYDGYKSIENIEDFLFCYDFGTPKTYEYLNIRYGGNKDTMTAIPSSLFDLPKKIQNKFIELYDQWYNELFTTKINPYLILNINPDFSDFNEEIKDKEINFFTNYHSVFLEKENGKIIGLTLILDDNQISTYVADSIKENIVLYSVIQRKNKHNKFSIGYMIKTGISSFSKKINEIADKKGQNEKENENLNQINTNSNTQESSYEDIKTAMYYELKSLCDGWLNANNESEWDIKSENGIWNKFKFIDTVYRDIGDKLMVNTDELFKMLENIDEPSYMSVYQLLSNISSQNGCVLMAQPIFNDWGKNGQVKDMFTPFSFNTMDRKENKTTYISLFIHEPSKRANIDTLYGGKYNYKDDGLDLTDSGGNILPQVPSFFDKKEGEDSYIVPAFGVTYGKQNQSIFKNITVGMEKPQLTGPAIDTIVNISEDYGNPNGRAIKVKGQDLYSVYKDYVYECSLEMLGNIQIQPLQYFQLNNIPLFKGAYLIQNVSHTITPGNIITKIKGQRISKRLTKLNETPFNLSIDEINEKGGSGTTTDNSSYNGTNIDTISGGGTKGEYIYSINFIEAPKYKEVTSEFIVPNQETELFNIDFNENVAIVNGPLDYKHYFTIKPSYVGKKLFSIEEIKTNMKDSIDNYLNPLQLRWYSFCQRNNINEKYIQFSTNDGSFYREFTSSNANSAHGAGLAMDILIMNKNRGIQGIDTFRDFIYGLMYDEKGKLIKESEMKYDQLIRETSRYKNRWVHVGIKAPSNGSKRGNNLFFHEGIDSNYSTTAENFYRQDKYITYTLQDNGKA